MHHGRLLRQVERFLNEQHCATSGIVAAVSGGPDSVALFRALATLCAAEKLCAAHLNHQLRDAESDADEAFVRDLAVTHGIAFQSERLDVRALAIGANLEATARRLRYAWLTTVARERGATFIATGHTADDQAETVLHRLVRGTGLQGLRGIAPRRRLVDGVDLVRPILRVTKVEVLEYLGDLQQPFCHDRTNDDLDLTRNRLRRELVPLLRAQYNPAIVTVLGRLATQAAQLYREQEVRAAALLAASERPRAGMIFLFERSALAAAEPSVLGELFRLVWVREGWPLLAMTAAHWDRLVEVALGVRRAAQFPAGVRAALRPTVLQLSRTDVPRP